MKNNEWNIPSDYFEKNKKALMPVRKMTNRNWLLALAAACVIGVGLFMLKGEGRTQEIAEGKRREDIGAKYLSPEMEDMGSKNLSPEKEDVGAKDLSPKKENLSPKEEIADRLKEIPREELVAYLLEEDSELIENLN